MSFPTSEAQSRVMSQARRAANPPEGKCKQTLGMRVVTVCVTFGLLPAHASPCFLHQQLR